MPLINKSIFISHSHDDSNKANEICSILEEQGISCWIASRDIRPGFDYNAEIVDAIENAKAVILVLSQNSNISEHVNNEISLAMDNKKRVIPIRIEDVLPSKNLKYYITRKQFIDAWEPPLENKLEELLTTIKDYLDISEKNHDHLDEENRVQTHTQLSASNAKIVIFNTSSAISHFRTGDIEVEIDGNYLGKLRRRHYVETHLKYGVHKVSLRHWDVKQWEKSFDLDVQTSPFYMKVYAKPKSTQFEILEELPIFFSRKYKKVY
jgi:hypothetical protein